MYVIIVFERAEMEGLQPYLDKLETATGVFHQTLWTS